MYTVSAPPAQTYRRMLNRMGWSLLIFFGLFTATNLLVELPAAIIPMDSIFARCLYGVTSTVAYAAPFLIAGFLFYRMSGREKGKFLAPTAVRPVDDRLILPAMFPLLVLVGLSANQVAAELNFRVCEWIGFDFSIYDTAVYYDSADTVILYMTTAIAPAFAEEFLFRGVVFANLRPYGKWQAVFISALTFALMHQNPAQLFYTFVCGILLALMYEWTGSMWCGVIFHLLNNQISVLSEALIYGAYGENAYYITLIWNGVVVILGVIAAVILAVYATRRRREARARVSANPGIFGASDDRTATVEVWDRPLDGRSVRRGIRSPGMLIFIIVSAVTIVGTYLMSLAGNLESFLG